MGFLNPLVLAALAAVSVPVAIHLFNKFRVRETPWAAMRFVRLSLQKNQKKIRLEDLLLLLLRCLIVTALVLAFARPALRVRAGSGGGPGGGPVTAVILLDHSASMGQSNGLQTRFDEARGAIEKFLETLGPGSQAALYTVSNRADPVIAQPTSDFARIRRGLELASLSDRPSDLARGLAAAYGVLKPLTAERREIHFFTDNQKTAWAAMEEVRRLQRENPAITFVPRVIRPTGEDNLAVTALEVEGGVPAAGQTLRCRVEVSNFGATTAEGVRVTLALGDRAPSDEALIPRIEPGSTQSRHLFVRFEAPGFHHLTARIPPDRLPLDNARSAALRVVDQMRVLLVGSGDTPPPGSVADTFFVGHALAPVAPDAAADHYLALKTVPLRTLAGEDLSPYGLIVLCNIQQADKSIEDKIRKFVEAGGSLILFPGPKTKPERWSGATTWGGWLPAVWSEREHGGKNTAPARLQSEAYAHPVSSIWNNPDEGSLAGISLDRWRPLVLAEKSATGQGQVRVVLATNRGEPFLAEGPVGAGRVAVFAASASPESSNLPLHPAFVPLMQRLTGHLTGRDARRLTITPGEPFTWEMPMEQLGADFSVVHPGNKGEKQPAGRVELDGGKAVLRYRETDRTGVYQAFPDPENKPAAVFAVALAPSESDLRTLDAEEVEGLRHPPVGDGTVASPGLEIRQEFWHALIWVAACLVLLEALLAHRFTPAR